MGDIENGSLGGEAYQLKGASNRSSGSTRQGDLRATYDVTGNLTELRVDRDGTCIPSGKCSQVFRYQWDEVGRLVTAERWDAASLDVTSTADPVGVADVELHYAYDASDMRVSKRAVDTQGEESNTLYIFGSLELRRTIWDTPTQDYALNPETEVAYLFANGVRLARLAYEAPDDVPSIGGETLHVFFELGDHLGSTSVVLDKATGELVERSTYQAYGGSESDYRPERWKHFREDYRFTGKEEDVEVGLIYFGKRFLNPLLNRWVSADPLAVHGLGADPNLYAYVSGRVLQSVDPLGLEGMSDDEMTAEFDPDGESPRSQPNLHDTGEGGIWDPPQEAPDRAVVFNEEHILSTPKPIAQKRAERYEAAKDGTADGLLEFTETTLGGGLLMMGKKLELVPPRLLEGPAAPEDRDLAQHYDFAKKGAMAEAAGL